MAFQESPFLHHDWKCNHTYIVHPGAAVASQGFPLILSRHDIHTSLYLQLAHRKYVDPLHQTGTFHSLQLKTIEVYV